MTTTDALLLHRVIPLQDPVVATGPVYPGLRGVQRLARGVLGMIIYLDWGMDNTLPTLRLLANYGEAQEDSRWTPCQRISHDVTF
jgi:hypothetical protein